MKIKADGQLRHHFWGTYSATIVLAFADADCAKLAMTKLPGWTQGEKSPNVLVWFGEREALEEQEKLLVFFGAEAKAISSIAHSIDYGDRFSIEMEVEDPNQTSMFGDS